MSISLFLSPERILFGWGSVEKTGEETLRYGSKALLVSGKSSSRANGALTTVLSSLTASGVEVTLFCEVESDPSVHTVTTGAALARQAGASVVVALGGGSPLDAAKAIALMATNPGQIGDYEKTAPTQPGLPVVAIPTTAGTGSEVTKFVVITDTERKVKMLINSPYLIPRTALLDPQLTLSIPPAFTAGPGMDALTHAIEAYQSSLASPTTDVFALSAIKLIGGNLVQAVVRVMNLGYAVSCTPASPSATPRWRWYMRCRARSALISASPTDRPTPFCCPGSCNSICRPVRKNSSASPKRLAATLPDYRRGKPASWL